MDEAFRFATAQPWCAFGLALIVLSAFVTPFRCALLIYNRRRRSMNIIAKGWPPAHLDADGDWMARPETETV